MLMKRTLITLLTTLLLATAGWAQTEAQTLYSGLPIVLNLVQTKMNTNQQAYNWAQQMGNMQQMQYCQAEAQLHQMMMNGLTDLMQNPQRLNDPAVQQQYMNAVHEYNYRTDCRDLRPWDQIQGQLAQYIAHSQWKATTPEGRATHAATVEGIRSNTAASAAAHNQKMNALHQQEAARNQAWNQNQAQQDINHQRFVHGIYNQYQYVNPNTGQGYWVPMENQNPAVVNPNGTYTPLIPYQSY